MFGNIILAQLRWYSRQLQSMDQWELVRHSTHKITELQIYFAVLIKQKR